MGPEEDETAQGARDGISSDGPYIVVEEEDVTTASEEDGTAQAARVGMPLDEGYIVEVEDEMMSPEEDETTQAAAARVGISSHGGHVAMEEEDVTTCVEDLPGGISHTRHPRPSGEFPGEEMHVGPVGEGELGQETRDEGEGGQDACAALSS
jgi:hypothetical protein